MNQRRMTFRPVGPEALEDRAVPSASGVHALASTGTANSASIQQQLAQVDAQIGAAYSAFATGVFQAEAAFAGSGGTATTPLVTSVGAQIASLQQALTSAVHGSVTGNALGLVQLQITGSSPGSLSNVMTNLLTTATGGTLSGPIPTSSFPVLATAISGAIGSSYTSATVDAYIYATGKASGNTSNLNLAQADGAINVGYGSFATAIFQAESALIGSSATGTTTLNVVSVVNTQTAALDQYLSSLVAKTSVASRAAVLQGQFVGYGLGSLQGQMTNLIVAAANPDASVPQSSLPLLFAAVDDAIAASYESTAVEAYLLATS